MVILNNGQQVVLEYLQTKANIKSDLMITSKLYQCKRSTSGFYKISFTSYGLLKIPMNMVNEMKINTN